jgi:hypothetical protein
LYKILSLLIAFLPALLIAQQDITVKSLIAYPGDNVTELPVISGNKLTIEFDLQSDHVPQLSIVFRFCDRNWNPDGNLFLANNGYNIYSNIDYAVLPATVKEARYHFRGSFPDNGGQISFPFSGKWRYYITDAYDTSRVYASGKFVAITAELPMSVTLSKEKLEDKTYFPAQLAYIFNITTEFNLPEKFYPAFVDHVEIIENHKTDYTYIIGRSFNTNVRQYYWNGDRKFTFIARDVRPGNEYRQTDIRDYNKFSGETVKAQFDGLEYSRFYKEGPPDLNGGEIFLSYKNDYATYKNVVFSIRPPDENYGDIFLVGAFNNWKVLPEYKMNEQGGVYSITIPLKRGIYDYQYVSGQISGNSVNDIDWYTLEGNSWDTSNYYYIFLYYNDPDLGGYDHIIGYAKIYSKQ